MFKYAISTKMEVLNLSLGGPNYSALLFVKRIISQEYVAYNLVELIHFKLFCKGTYHFRLFFLLLQMDIGDIPNTEAAVVLPNEVKQFFLFSSVFTEL
ncbi:hypothetical protein MKW98_009801 [Papaver atlanticum]|uniref:Uncharacterized protein n=1 Tax=Papaver atlanticum TaxID=357466 RepID=A0AAD4SV98_9MAGN|nr:hypothetical protein MKW98_009801 [Papaver atlanticum]